ncbi:MAG: DEAD/DEAH box helicase family protein [Bacteroides sp.]|nr:DEAD/DEAH box helicase family protein [Bacteroides sp.]
MADRVLDELAWLRAENARLRSLLARYEIEADKPQLKIAKPLLSLKEKVELFRELFRGREDVFARRWVSLTTGQSGYQPVCMREWDRVYCDKKKQKCTECPNRKLQPLGYDDIYRHLEGKDSNGRDVIGVYAILEDNTCNFLCCDFDDKSCEHGYRDDVRAYVSVCRDWEIPAYVERSRSGSGAHVWVLFSEPVQARQARRLGNAVLTEAMDREGRMSFKSYDRFFPNQDFVSQGGFGNLVALPLQGQARRNGNSVFVDDNFVPFDDQWDFLKRVKRMSLSEVENILCKYGTKELLGDLSRSNEAAPWERPRPKTMDSSDFPRSITLVRASGIYIPTKVLSAKSINHLRRIAAFKNPEFYARLGMRLPVYNLPRVISCSEITDDYLFLPRGCEDSAVDFLRENNVMVSIEDKTTSGDEINVTFNGTLYPVQQRVLDELSKYRCGTLHAMTAFGKTVTGAALIAEKKTNTLILVHTKALLEQWRTELEKWLNVDFRPQDEPKRRGRKKKFQKFGALSSTENSLNGKIDIALLQSCISDNEVRPFVRDYGMVIVDECHHAPAVNFERVLREVNAYWIYGLTATPIRKDGHQPIIFMQCGEIRYSVDSKIQQESQSFRRLLIPRFSPYRPIDNLDGKNYAQVCQALSLDEGRNKMIIDDVKDALSKGRSPIILTARTAHVDLLAQECEGICQNVIRLVGNDSTKMKRAAMERLSEIPDSESLVVVATGKYVGEGFNLPRLDTLMLALPVSWKGLIAQYAGRLHRDFEGKEEVRIYDYIDLRLPICDAMYRKRIQGYKSIGYSISVGNEGLFSDSKADAIYGIPNFERVFHNDIASAKRSIVISTIRLRWNRLPRIIDLLAASVQRGVNITIIIAEVGYQEESLRQMGFSILHRPECKMQAAIIDQHIGWYGSVNLIGKSIEDATSIRLDSSDFTSSLFDAMKV